MKGDLQKTIVCGKIDPGWVVCLKHLHVIARREGMGGVGKERECECKKEGETLCQCMCNCVHMYAWVCVCVCACVYVVIRQQLLGFNLVSFVNISVISSEFVSLSPHSTPPPPLLETSFSTQCAHASPSLSLRLSCTLSLSRSTGLFSPSYSVSPQLIPCYVL